VQRFILAEKYFGVRCTLITEKSIGHYKWAVVHSLNLDYKKDPTSEVVCNYGVPMNA